MNLDLFVTRRSGAGEHIMRAGLARTIADVLRPGQDSAEVDVHDVLTRTLSAHFYGKFEQTKSP
jgi:taspase (threonine aspartase 1)